MANALGYKDERSVHKIYERNKEEFSSMMSVVVNLTTGIVEVPTRIFSLRGCHLIAMFARTPVAKQFRRWVLDVLDKLAEEERALHGGNVNTIFAPSTPADRRPLEKLVKVWASQAHMPHAQGWAQVNAHFNLNSISELPVEWIPDAIAFVEGKIDALPKSLPSAPQPHLFDQLRLSSWDKVQMGKRVRQMLDSEDVGQHTMECVLLKARYVAAIDDVYRLCNQLHTDLRKAVRSPYAAARQKVNTAGNVWTDSLTDSMYADHYRIMELGKEFHSVAFRALNTGICMSRMMGM